MKESRRSTRSLRRAAPFLIFLLALVLLAALLLLAGRIWAGTDRLCPGLRAGGLSLGGLRRSEARERLEEAGWGKWLDRSVTVVFPDGSAYPVTAREAGMERDPAEIADELYGAGGGSSAAGRPPDR